MRLTEEEKKICKQYSKPDAEGKYHCGECPLHIELYGAWPVGCKATMRKEEWEEWHDGTLS